MKHDTPAAGELVSLGRFRPLRRYAMLIAVLLAMALGFPARAAGPATLVKDINPGAGGSDPSFLTDVNGTLFFSASDGGFFDNRELWTSDGTPAGTVRVKDIRPGPFESNPSGLT